jgi:hypothetical protein
VTFLGRRYKTWLKRKNRDSTMSQKIERLLRNDDAVPDEQIFEGNTTSTPAVKLTRLRKKLAREGNDTIPHIQGYRLDECELPAGLERAPKLFQLATTLNGSTAQSIDQLSEKVWGRLAANNVTNGISQLRHEPWSLNIVSTGYHGIRANLCDCDRQPSATHASTATAQPEDRSRPISLAKVSMQELSTASS